MAIDTVADRKLYKAAAISGLIYHALMTKPGDREEYMRRITQVIDMASEVADEAVGEDQERAEKVSEYMAQRGYSHISKRRE